MRGTVPWPRALEAVTGLRPHQVPAIERFVEPIGDVLHLHRQPAIGLGGAHQLLQSLFAQLDLILQNTEVVLPTAGRDGPGAFP
jgi:hypothetical protein